MVLFQIRNRPPQMRIRSRPEISVPMIEKSGEVSPMSQVSENRSAMRMNMARPRPTSLAFSC